ncbi:MAG: VWA domain-containing protein, partial [Acidobacteria bacterium]|nr:VWA domain-containing protein [Acidobacteriota bacterium]
VEIRDVEIYATVVDPDGEPVRGLRASDFTVQEEGKAKPIHGFEFLEQAPWTAGIAIDSSGSMQKRMAEVRAAAKGFAGRTIENGGRAFVVDFDTTPRLAHPTSAAAASVSAAIDRIGAGGDTALWDAIIFSLLQLQGVDGKRALVVLSDGRNLESRYRYDDVDRVARETGAAVYVIVVPARYSPADQAAMYERNALATLARSTGGEVWFLREGDSLAAVYETIDRQLRSQYVLTYRTEPARGTDDWRKVDVRLSNRKLRARTIAGYFPR